MADSTHPGKYLARIRKIAGLSLERVARDAGIAASYLAQIEQGQGLRPANAVVSRVSAAIAQGLKCAA